MNEVRVQRIYAFIKAYTRHHGVSPTIRGIGVACGISSTSVVSYYLDKLEDVGKIFRMDKGRAGIGVTGMVILFQEELIILEQKFPGLQEATAQLKKE